MRGAFLAFEWEKGFRICTCIGELDTGKIKFRQSRFWTSLLPDSQISWIVTLPRDWASTRPATSPSRDGNQWIILPTAKHISKLEEEIVSQWFCQYVRFLLSGSAIRDLNPSVLNKWTKVVVFKCDVFCPRRKFLRRGHGYARLIILVHFAYKCGSLHVNREDSVNFFEERD